MKFINKLTEIKIEYFMIFFLIIMILPFLMLNYYNIPDPEDIHWTEVVKEVGYPDAQIKFRENWSGRFFSYALLSLNALYSKSFTAHKILTLCMMILMFYMIYILISEIFKKSISASRKILFSLSVFFMYLFMMPIVSEGLYWMTSLYVYHLGIFLIILFFIFYMRYTDDDYSSRKKLYLLLCSLTIIAISGCCEMAMPLVFILIAFLFIKKLITEKKADYTLIYFTVLIFLSMYFVTSAPGNSLRSGSFPDSHIFISSVINSFVLLSKKLIIWTILSPLIAVSFFLIPSISKFVSSQEKNLRIFRINPVFPVIIWLAFLFMCIFLFYWSMGKSPYLRSLNFVYFIYLLGWFYVVINILFYTYSKFNLLIKKIPTAVYAAGITVMIIFLIRENNVKSAYAELFSGSAKKYSEEMYQRFDYIKQSSSDSVGVDPVRFPSKFLFVRDIREDPGFWKNVWYAKFFNKKYIYLKKSSAQPEQ